VHDWCTLIPFFLDEGLHLPAHTLDRFRVGSLQHLRRRGLHRQLVWHLVPNSELDYLISEHDCFGNLEQMLVRRINPALVLEAAQEHLAQGPVGVVCAEEVYGPGNRRCVWRV
jgi:hypothetical protein